MDWSSGYSARYLVYEVDPISWRDTTPIDIIDGSISKNDEALLQSADLTCFNFDGSSEKWIRIYLEARQVDDAYYGPLFTGLASSPNKNIDGTFISTPVQCFSVLKPADDILLSRGWFANSKADGVEIIKDLLKVTPAPINVSGATKSISENIIAEDGETNLSMATKILKIMNWEMRIGGDGTILLRPSEHSLSNNNIVIFDSVDQDCLETDVRVKYDWFSCPNVFRASYGDLIAVARDEDPDSIFSIPNRGREIWKEETDCNLNDGEDIAMYAKRKLKEAQQASCEVSYSRRFNPNVDIFDIIGLNYPAQDLSGYYRVTSQTIRLGSSSVSESVYKIV